MHCRMCSSIPGLHSLDAASILLSWNIQGSSNAFWQVGDSPLIENRSANVTASYLSLGEGSEACLAAAESSYQSAMEWRCTLQPPDIMGIEIMPNNRFVFIAEHFISTYKVNKADPCPRGSYSLAAYV